MDNQTKRKHIPQGQAANKQISLTRKGKNKLTDKALGIKAVSDAARRNK